MEKQVQVHRSPFAKRFLLLGTAGKTMYLSSASSLKEARDKFKQELTVQIKEDVANFQKVGFFQISWNLFKHEGHNINFMF